MCDDLDVDGSGLVGEAGEPSTDNARGARRGGAVARGVRRREGGGQRREVVINRAVVTGPQRQRVVLRSGTSLSMGNLKRAVSARLQSSSPHWI